MLEYGSRAISVITIASGNFALMSLIDLGTIPMGIENMERRKILN